jgi:hypothetical protein
MQLITEALVPHRQNALHADGKLVREGRLARLRSRRRGSAVTTTPTPRQTWSTNGHRPARVRAETVPATCN